ncbi:MAG: hypothetical protein V3571_01900 [Pseudodesulfovibrio sp.]
MSEHPLFDLITYLETIAVAVRRLEEEGDVILRERGQDAFTAKMTEKARLLAGLGEKGRPLAEKVGGESGRAIVRRLDQFSASAGASLRIGSVFFMTALLYPADHKAGEPNDLEAYIGTLREKL